MLVLDPVHNHVFPNGQAAVSGAEILVWMANKGEATEHKETICDVINQAIGNLDTAAFLRNV